MKDLAAAKHIDLHTGAWRREYFESELGKALAAGRKQKHPFALLRLDVDDLQEQNDLHGRAALDDALASLVTKVAQCVDGRGPIGRLGGDDFAVFLSGVAREEARRLAERLMADIAREQHFSANGPFHLTISVGVAFARAGEPAGNLLDAAEDACTRAKQSGRNRAVQR